MTNTRTLSGWGRWPRESCNVVEPPSPDAVSALAATLPSLIPFGLGRSYGDSPLNPEGTLLTRQLDRMLAFDDESGALVAEAGVSLAAIIEAFLPRGFFPMVTPGTKFVTLGGAIAADVHGKNHHRDGSFGDHVLWLDLLGPDGTIRRCAPDQDGTLFNATLGGMGLTGVILRAAIRLRRVETAWIRKRTIVAPDLDAAMAAFEAHAHVTYSVAWIDCLAGGAARGRSLVYVGEHAPCEALPPAQAGTPFAVPRRCALRVPVDAPSLSLNRLTVSLFNHLYFRAGQREPGETLIDWDRYFYPLDAVRDWNRIYGRRGFAQYQCAVPLESAHKALGEMLDVIAESGRASFLAVLKRFGPGAPARPLSFPMEGYTLALDFPMSPEALALMDRLDSITRDAAGRLYLAKDSRMSRETFEAGYGAAAAEFAALRRARQGPIRFESLQGRRIGL